MLAKRFAMMHKNYRKFSIKFLGKDPIQTEVINDNEAPTQNE